MLHCTYHYLPERAFRPARESRRHACTTFKIPFGTCRISACFLTLPCCRFRAAERHSIEPLHPKAPPRKARSAAPSSDLPRRSTLTRHLPGKACSARTEAATAQAQTVVLRPTRPKTQDASGRTNPSMQAPKKPTRPESTARCFRTRTTGSSWVFRPFQAPYPSGLNPPYRTTSCSSSA